MPLLYQQNINEHVKWALWKVSEAEDFFKTAGFLANHISHPEKRIQHLAGRFLLKKMLPGLLPENIVAEENSKPYITSDPDLDFSVSHAKDMVGVIVGKNHKVGMDVELQAEKVMAVKHKFMSEDDELSFTINAFSDLEKATICWTIKESAFKLMGKRSIDFKRDLFLKKVSKENEGWFATLKYADNPDMELSATGLMINHFQICTMVNKR